MAFQVDLCLTCVDEGHVSIRSSFGSEDDNDSLPAM